MDGGKLPSAVMVGDSEADVNAARGAEIPVIAAGFGYAATPAGKLGADDGYKPPVTAPIFDSTI